MIHCDVIYICIITKQTNISSGTNTRTNRLKFGPAEFQMLHSMISAGEGVAVDVTVGDVAVGIAAGDKERRCDAFHPGVLHMQ